MSNSSEYSPVKLDFHASEEGSAKDPWAYNDDADGPPPAYQKYHNGSTVDTKYEKSPYLDEDAKSSMPTYSPYAPNPEASGSTSSNKGLDVDADQQASDASPPSFRRPAPHGLSYPPFETAVLYSSSTELQKGFPPQAPPYPPRLVHPFASHDVNEQDWLRLLNDVRVAAEASPVSKVLQGVAPIARRIPVPFAGMLVSKGIEMHLNNRKKGPVGDVIDEWNQRFFHRRRLHVILAQGKISYSGPEVPPPDLAMLDSHSGHSLEFTDAEDDSLYAGASMMVSGVLRKPKEWGAAYRHQKQRRQDWSDSTRKKWRLIVTFQDYIL